MAARTQIRRVSKKKLQRTVSCCKAWLPMSWSDIAHRKSPGKTKHSSLAWETDCNLYCLTCSNIYCYWRFYGSRELSMIPSMEKAYWFMVKMLWENEITQVNMNDKYVCSEEGKLLQIVMVILVVCLPGNIQYSFIKSFS